MAQIEHHHAYVEGPITGAVQPGWNTVLNISTLSANAKYFIFVQLLPHSIAPNTSITFMRVTLDGVSLGGETIGWSQESDNVGMFIHEVTTDSSPSDLVLQTNHQDTASAPQIRHARMFAMRLDDDLVEGRDYKFGEDTTFVNYAAVPEDWATITFNSGQINDWVVFGTVQSARNSGTSNSFDANFVLDGASSGDDTLPTIVAHTRSVNDEEYPAGNMRYYSGLAGASHTILLRSTGAGTGQKHRRSALFALNLARFKDFKAVFSSATQVITSASTWEELEDMSYTPTVVADNLMVSIGTIDKTSSGTGTFKMRHQLTGSTDPTNYDSFNQGATDTKPTQLMASSYFSSMATSAQDLDVDIFNTVAGNTQINHWSSIILSMEMVDNRFISGTVTEKGQKVSRQVIVYRRSAPYEVLGTTMSAADGSYTVNFLPNAECMVVAQDDDAGTDFNAVIITRVIPEIN